MMKLTKLLTVDRLKNLTPPQLKQIKRALQKFFYLNGTNVAFHEARNSKKSKEFENKVRKALYNQIFYLAEIDKVSQITNKFSKAANKKLIALVSILWLAFEDALDGGMETVASYLRWAGEKGGESALDKMIPPAYVFELKDKRLIKKLDTRVNFLKETLDKTGVGWTAEVIARGVEEGLTNAEIVKFLRREANKVARQRADVITETELMTAMNIVEVETFKRNGIEKHRWITTLAERSCEICVVNEEAGPIPVGEEFPSGHIAPLAHVRCSCYLLPVLPIALEGKVWTGG